MAKRPTETKQPDLPPPPTDEGRLTPPAEGGSYIIENGVRRRVEAPTKDSNAGAGDGVGGAAIDGDGHPSEAKE
jgi:hypothetical protein